MSIPNGYTQGTIEEYTEAGYWTSEIIPDYVDKNASEKYDRLSYIQGENRYTWGEYGHLVNRLALILLSIGVKRDDRFGVYLPDWMETHLFYDALSKIGAITVAINIGQRAKEVEHMMKLMQQSLNILHQVEMVLLFPMVLQILEI